MANKYTRKGQKQSTDVVVSEKDEFVSFWERAFKVVEPQFRNIAIGIAVIAGVLVIAWIGSTIRDGWREEATEAFAQVVKIHEADLLPEDKAADKAADKADDKAAPKPDQKAETKADKPAEHKEGEVPRFKTAQARAEATLAELDKLEKQHGSSAVTKKAHLFRAGVLFELGRYDEARKLADEVGSDSDNGTLAIIARESAGLALEAQGKLDEALAVFKDVEARGGDLLRDRAQFDQARVLERKGDTEGAKKLYKQIADKAPIGMLKDEAQNRLALLGG